ncbi:MAG TPA: hypothetical protein VGA17_08340 [Nitrospiraceae bacterium]
MSKITELKASIGKTLEALEREMLALDAQLMQTKEQALKGLEQRQRHLRESLDRVEGDVRAKLEHLRAHAALGKADARDAFEEQRAKLTNALRDFESASNQKLKAAAFESGKVWDDLVERAKTLDAELEALKGRVGKDAAKQQAALESKMQELRAKLPAYKSNMKEKRREIEAKAAAFEDDLRKGLDQIKSGFKRLFE